VDPVAVRAALVIALVLACAAIWRWWPSGSESTGSFTAGARDADGTRQVGKAAPTGAPSQADESSRTLLVHVVGSVRRPGVYSLVTGSRVIDAVTAAGGMLSDAAPSAVNLARAVTDGEQVVVPDQDEAEKTTALAGASGGGGNAPGTRAPIDLNAADAAALDGLPGVGPATAAKIIADRETNGPFASTGDLTRVPGIGEKKLAQLEGLICVR
jgi:competence protein ComEA